MAPVPLLAAAGACALAALVWLAFLARPARPWDLAPVGEDEPAPPEPPAWPEVAVLVPARDEAAYLPRTLPALLAQDYPGAWRAVLVDDRSTDGTAGVARALGAATPRRLTVVEGAPLPEGWAGKVWALEQGAAAAGSPEYYLLTDADVHHEPGSLRRLVAESEAAGLDLNSRMVRLRCESVPERLLVPAFVFFFAALYPMRLVNDPRRRTAAAAGGCVLVRRETLERAGGLRSIRGEVIDDVNLARRVKRLGARIRLATSRRDVVSLRAYGSVGAVWRMVRRTAFDQLRYSSALLVLTVAGLALLFPLPPLAALAGAGLAAARAAGALEVAWWACVLLGGAGLSAWALQAAAYAAAVRFFGLAPAWALALPAAGALYGGMTIDSALRHLARRRQDW